MAATFCILFFIALSVALPAKHLYDTASANDINVNSIHSDNNNDITTTKIVQQHAEITLAPLPDTTLKINIKQNYTPTLQNQAGSGFGRLIDDIFNIPITVLQAVAKLLRNPFKQEVKTVDATTY